MFGNLSIRSKLLALLAVPVAATVLLDVAGVTAAWGDRARAIDERRAAAVPPGGGRRPRATGGGSGGAWVAGRGGRPGRAARPPAAGRRRPGRLPAGAAGLAPPATPALDQAVAVATERLDRLGGPGRGRPPPGHPARVLRSRRHGRRPPGGDPRPGRPLEARRGQSARLLLALTAAREARPGAVVLPPPDRARGAARTGRCGCAWPPPPPWPARSSRRPADAAPTWGVDRAWRAGAAAPGAWTGPARPAGDPAPSATGASGGPG